jgi:hypothetical protein
MSRLEFIEEMEERGHAERKQIDTSHLRKNLGKAG